MRGRAVPRVVEDRDRSGAGAAGHAETRPCQPHDQEAPQHLRILSHMADENPDPGICQRALPCVPAGAARPHRRRRLLGVARHDARARPGSDPGTCPRPSTPPSTARCAPPGYTAVGEFHYLGLAEAHAAVEAAAEAGVEIVLLYVAYERGGLERFRQESVGGVPAPARGAPGETACASASPPTPCARAHATGSRSSAAMRRRRACPCTSTPTSSRARSRSASPSTACARSSCSPRPAASTARTTVVHATHADGRELDLLGQAGARVCACPTTEANLGDGFLPVERVLHRGIALCIGSDSNVRIDPLEELRELDGIARRQAGRRDVLTVDALLSIGRRRRRRVTRARDVAVDRDRRRTSAAPRRRGSASALVASLLAPTS